MMPNLRCTRRVAFESMDIDDGGGCVWSIHMIIILVMTASSLDYKLNSNEMKFDFAFRPILNQFILRIYPCACCMLCVYTHFAIDGFYVTFCMKFSDIERVSERERARYI